MIVEAQQHIATCLKTCMGSSTLVYTTKKELTDCAESHVAAVLLERETLTVSNTRSGPGHQRRLFDRAVQFSVVMGEYSMAKLEPMYIMLLANIGRCLHLADGSDATIELGEAEWTDKDDGILKAKVAVLLPVTITGGVYQPIQTTSISEVNITVEQED